jgi:hypothetical protein
MRSGRTWWSRAGKLGVGLFLLSGAVQAQAPAPPPGPWLPPEPGVEVRVPLRPTLSPQEMLKEGNSYRRTMAAVADGIERQLQSAHREKDLIKINCLSDKLIQARANLNVADTSFRAMQEAIRRDNEGGAFYQYSRLAILNQNVQTLVMEANGCIGADLSFVGAVRVDVTTEGVPGGDPTQEEEEEIPGITRPPPASPYL